jgi:hypothetical protein
MIQPVAVSPAQKPAQKPILPVPLLSDAELSGLLKKAGITSPVRATGAEGFTWKSGIINGAASVQKAASFQQQVNSYIAQQKGRCDGDFASMPTPGDTGGKTMEMMEIACVSGGESKASSVVFYVDDGRFIALANETDASSMDAAMDMRDRIAEAVRGM